MITFDTPFVWDGTSNVNNATPEYILETNPWADVVYLLLVNGSVVYLQTHNPFEQGWIPITTATVEAISNAHAQQLATQYAHSQILEEIITDLDLQS